MQEAPVAESVAQEAVVEPVAVVQESVVQEAVVQEAPVVQEAVVQEAVAQEAPVVQEAPIVQEAESDVVVQEVVVQEAVVQAERPTTHHEVLQLQLFFTMKHFLSAHLLTRAMCALLDVVPNSWEWAANVDVNNINEGVDPLFDAILQHMNLQTNLKHDVTWETKPVFAWIVRQLRYIAKHGVTMYKQVYSVFFQDAFPKESLWNLETDPCMVD